jgi:protein-S-isoprenylcysteine O-methyltransferase
MILLQPRPLVMLYLGILGLFLVFEIFLWRRSKGIVLSSDRGFAFRLWANIVVGQLIAMLCLRFVPQANFGAFVTSCIGVALMVTGVILRWWAIVHLGRFFTVYLRIAPDQRVIDNGPYRYIRHPSYTGILLFMLGWGLCFGNLLSVLAIVAPIVVILVARIRNEETLLVTELGDAYRNYMHRTKRLIPMVL